VRALAATMFAVLVGDLRARWPPKRFSHRLGVDMFTDRFCALGGVHEHARCGIHACGIPPLCPRCACGGTSSARRNQPPMCSFHRSGCPLNGFNRVHQARRRVSTSRGGSGTPRGDVPNSFKPWLVGWRVWFSSGVSFGCAQQNQPCVSSARAHPPNSSSSWQKRARVLPSCFTCPFERFPPRFTPTHAYSFPLDVS
jgi:hypothetical protein